MPKFCSNCGTEIVEESSSCPSCGAEIINSFSTDKSKYEEVIGSSVNSAKQTVDKKSKSSIIDKFKGLSTFKKICACGGVLLTLFVLSLITVIILRIILVHDLSILLVVQIQVIIYIMLMLLIIRSF